MKEQTMNKIANVLLGILIGWVTVGVIFAASQSRISAKYWTYDERKEVLELLDSIDDKLSCLVMNVK